MSLKEIAEMMRKEAQRDGVAEITLERGLNLLLRREGTIWTLTMKRRGERPSPQEQAIVRNCFDVPKKIKAKYQEETSFYFVILAWTDADEKATEAPKPVQPRLM
jgi:hypothetical protein